MNWFKRANINYTGYKVVQFNDGKAFSLYQQEKEYPLSIGSEISDANGIYLGTSEKFCIDYYSELTDYDDILLIFSFNKEDILKGDPSSPSGEILVTKAKLKGYRQL